MKFSNLINIKKIIGKLRRIVSRRTFYESVDIANGWEEIQKIPFAHRATSINTLVPKIILGTKKSVEIIRPVISEKNICLPKKKDVIFFFEEAHKNVGSTFMRGEQLCNLLSNQSDKYNVSYSTYYECKNKILFLTKGFLKNTTPEILRKIHLNGNIILADFVDEPPNLLLIDEIDVLIASSIKSYIYYKMKWSEKPSFHVTHHVDPRITQFKTEKMFNGLKIGYFGEIVNTKITDEISKYVDFTRVNCSESTDNEWMKKLNDYNCHYAIRQHRKHDGFKPFMKGFVAAHCNANIIVQRNESDALYYLGSDYPFLIDGNATGSEVLNMLRRVKESYGDADWKHGLDIMCEIKERTSNAFVLNEFLHVIESL